MRILCLYGSPRPAGNSAALADAFCDAAEARGASINRVRLNDLDYKGCQGCLACKKKSDVCVVQDGLAPVLEMTRQADCLALATPVYYGDVSAQLKGFIDRTFSFLTPDYATNRDKRSRLEPGRSFVFLMAQGHPLEERFDDIYPRYQRFFAWLGFDKPQLVRACGVYHLGEMEQREDMLDAAREAAATVCTQEGA